MHVKQVYISDAFKIVWKVEKSAGHLSCLALAEFGVEWILPLRPTESDLVPTGKVSNLTIGEKERLRGYYSSLCVRVCYARPISRACACATALCTKCMSWSYLLLTVFRPWTLAALGSRGRTQSRRPEARKAWKCPVDEILRKRRVATHCKWGAENGFGHFSLVTLRNRIGKSRARPRPCFTRFCLDRDVLQNSPGGLLR